MGIGNHRGRDLMAGRQRITNARNFEAAEAFICEFRRNGSPTSFLSLESWLQKQNCQEKEYIESGKIKNFTMIHPSYEGFGTDHCQLTADEYKTMETAYQLQSKS